MNVMQTQSKAPLATLGLALASSFGAIAFSTPAYSINVDLSTFDSIGDVSNSNTTISSGSNPPTVITRPVRNIISSLKCLHYKQYKEYNLFLMSHSFSSELN